MSFRLVAKVLRESDETAGRRLILIALAEAASDDGVAWIAQETIASKARLSRTHTVELLHDMEGAAIETRKAQRGRRRINVYRVLLDGLDEVNYDRLPFTLDQPFSDDVGNPDVVDRRTTSDPPGDYVGSSGSTTSDLPGKSLARPLIGPVIGPVADPATSSPSSWKVDRRQVAPAEAALASLILTRWNDATDQTLRSRDWLAKIVMRIREYPELDDLAHDAIIRNALAHPWWSGPATPSVVYGSGAQFERCVVAWRTGNAGGRADSVSAEQIARHAEALRRQGQ